MKVSVPLHGCEHFYLLTKPLQEPLPPSTPGLTQDNCLFLAAGTVANIFKITFTVLPADVYNREEPPHFDYYYFSKFKLLEVAGWLQTSPGEGILTEPVSRLQW